MQVGYIANVKSLIQLYISDPDLFQKIVDAYREEVERIEIINDREIQIPEIPKAKLHHETQYIMECPDPEEKASCSIFEKNTWKPERRKNNYKNKRRKKH